MPERKKAHRLTNDEALRRLFPKEAREAAKSEAEVGRKRRKSREKRATKKDSN
jgi:hypothetical protein